MIEAIFPIISKALDLIFPDPQKAAEAKAKLLTAEAQAELKRTAEQVKVIVAEAQSEDKWVRRWRPSLMYIFMLILLNNYILYPYLSLFWQEAPVLEIPDQMWSLLMIGVGGYTIGRSAEKVVKNLPRRTDSG